MSSGFISEGDIAQRKRARQEQWEKTRKPDDPLEPPEEAIEDHRSLYERLQEVKQKKQDDWEEAHKLKNMVRGLEDDEVDFLELVDKTKLTAEAKVRKEEKAMLEEYRKKRAETEINTREAELRAEVKASEVRKTSSSDAPKKTSQTALLAGAIKRKAPSNSQTEDAKKPKSDNSTDVQNDSTDSTTSASAEGGLKCIGVLPGLGVYTDSSDSENGESSSEEDYEPQGHLCGGRDIAGRKVKCSSKGHHGE